VKSKEALDTCVATTPIHQDTEVGNFLSSFSKVLSAGATILGQFGATVARRFSGDMSATPEASESSLISPTAGESEGTPTEKYDYNLCSFAACLYIDEDGHIFA